MGKGATIENMRRGATIEIIGQGLMTETMGQGLTTVRGLTIITTNNVSDQPNLQRVDNRRNSALLPLYLAAGRVASNPPMIVAP